MAGEVQNNLNNGHSRIIHPSTDLDDFIEKIKKTPRATLICISRTNNTSPVTKILPPSIAERARAIDEFAMDIRKEFPNGFPCLACAFSGEGQILIKDSFSITNGTMHKL